MVSSETIPTVIPLPAPWHSEQALRDDTLLDLLCSSVDAGGPGSEIVIHNVPFVGEKWRGSRSVEHHPPQALLCPRHEKLIDRCLWTRRHPFRPQGQALQYMKSAGRHGNIRLGETRPETISLSAFLARQQGVEM